MEYVVKIKIEAENDNQVRELGNLLQFSVNNINRAELIKLLSKVKENPSIVKTALKFI